MQVPRNRVQVAPPQTAFARVWEAGVVREKGLHVHEVAVIGRRRAERGAKCGPAHEPVFRILRYRSGGHAQQPGTGFVVRPVRRRHQQAVYTELVEIRTKTVDRGGDAIDTGKEDVGDDERADAQTTTQARLARATATPSTAPASTSDG